MDVLTDILDAIHLNGAVYFQTLLREPWGFAVDADHQARFHIVCRGACVVEIEGVPEPVFLSPGDLLAFPKGAAHRVKDAPASALMSISPDLVEPRVHGVDRLEMGGSSGMTTELVCGYFCFDRSSRHPLIQALPEYIHIRQEESMSFPWLETTARFLHYESHYAKVGAQAVINSLTRVLFVQVLRAYIELQQSESLAEGNYFSALGDSYIGKALNLIHGDIAMNWSVESLGLNVGLSRTAFANRFHRLVGMPPAQYITEWRMQKAAQLLMLEGSSTAAVSLQVGYQSEAAFAKAFKRYHEVGPGQYRRSRQGMPGHTM